jgi:DNA polymerase-3 subunit delta
MASSKPVVYLFYGEDDFAIAQEIASLEGKMGDPALASLNTNRLDGSKTSLEEIRSVVMAMPVLLERRLVILERPTQVVNRTGGRKGDGSPREKFLELLDQLPATTALVLAEYQTLTSDRERQNNKIHWLERWTDQAGGRAYKRLFPLPSGAAMQRWIQGQAGLMNGRFTPQAAALLADLVGSDTRLAYNEIEKSLAYSGYQRPVEVEDVENLAVSARQVDVFSLVDAIGNQDGRRALGLLHRLLVDQEAGMIFGMVVRQFRLLIQAREVLDGGGSEGQLVSETGMHPYVARKTVAQVRPFSMARLVEIYHRLLEIDEAVKTGQIDIDIALDTFITAITVQPM